MSHYTSAHYLAWKTEASAIHGQEKSAFYVLTIILCMFSCRCGLSFVKGYMYPKASDEHGENELCLTATFFNYRLICVYYIMSICR